MKEINDLLKEIERCEGKIQNTPNQYPSIKEYWQRTAGKHRERIKEVERGET